MRNIIQQVMEAEAEAKRMVSAAREEAEEALTKARREAQQILEDGRREACAEADRIRDAAQADGEREKRERIEAARAELDTAVGLDPAIRKEALDAVARCVCGDR
jgi:vacuolar-type H+-ATPase subunit H